MQQAAGTSLAALATLRARGIALRHATVSGDSGVWRRSLQWTAAEPGAAWYSFTKDAKLYDYKR